MSQGFATAYYDRDPRSEGFLPPRYREASEWRSAVSAARNRTLAPALLEELRRQQERFGASPQRTWQLERLSQPGATVVVTGQQLGLFLGPLYTVYKALTAIEWASKLEEATGAPVVPLFWLQTEDHDFDEIARFSSVDDSGDVRTIQLSPRGERRSVAHLELDGQIEDAVAQLGKLLASLPKGEEELERYRSRYLPGHRWVDAFAGVLAECFAEEGLLLLDPRCEAVASLAAPIHERALEESTEIGRELLSRARALEAEGFAVQVKVRPEHTLSFFHPDGPAGERFRLKASGADFELAGRAGTVSGAQLRRRLERDPLCFSSSALLRPLIQDLLLPNAAYVGGPGEISYFSELAPLYQRFERDLPLVIPRRHFAVVEPASRRVLEGLGLEADRVTEERIDEIARARMQVDPEALRRRLHNALEHELSGVEADLLAVDPGLSRPMNQTRGTIGFALDRLTSRVEDAQRRTNQNLERRLRLLRAHLLPGGAPQERVHGCPRYFARFGVAAFKSALRQASSGKAGQRVVVEPAPIPTGGAL